jgi:hypothetical protein
MKARALDPDVTQFDLFGLRAAGHLAPGERLERIAGLDEMLTRQRDPAWRERNTFWRAEEYALATWPRDSSTPPPPLGAEVVWIEPAWIEAEARLAQDRPVTCRFRVPDTTVLVGDSRLPLREVRGVVVIRSIDRLELAQTAASEYVVSVRADADPDATFRVVDWPTNNWALADQDGYPTRRMPPEWDPYEGGDALPEDARFGRLTPAYGAGITGWHGSLLYDTAGTGGRDVCLGFPWFEPTSVAAVSTRGDGK